jgi:hypothetical protein
VCVCVWCVCVCVCVCVCSAARDAHLLGSGRIRKVRLVVLLVRAHRQCLHEATSLTQSHERVDALEAK